MKRSPLLIGASVVALALADGGVLTTSARGQTAASTPAPPANASDQAQCHANGGTSRAVQREVALGPDGKESPATPSDGKGRKYYFSDDVSTVNPPPGFKPLTATDQELATYNFLPRPTDPAELEHWKSLYANFHNSDNGQPTMCTSSDGEWFVGTDSHWSGAVLNSAPPEGYWTSQIGFKQTAFDNLSGCAGYTDSSYGTWAGIGGYYSKKLLQAGTLTGYGSINELHNFWEVQDSAGDPDHAHYIDNKQTAGGDLPRGGDIIYASVQNYNNDHAVALVVNQTKGYNDNATIGANGVLNGLPLTEYIDATTADFITENSQTDHPFLRKPHLNNTWTFWQTADSQHITGWSGRFGLDEYSWRYMQRIETYPPNIGWDGGENWYSQWINCW